MSVKPLHQIDPEWRDVALLPFRKQNYPQALERALAYLEGLPQRPKFKETLALDHYGNIYNNISVSAYHIAIGQIDTADPRDDDAWKTFFSYLDAYLDVAEQGIKEQPGEGCWQDPRFPTTLLGYAIDLLLQQQPTALRDELQTLLKRFLEIWPPTVALDKLFDAVNDERVKLLQQGNQARPQDNVQVLAKLYLDLTESLPAETYRHPRALVMDMLSDLPYFMGGEDAEEQALHWVKSALAINPEDRFALQRKKDIEERRSVMEQIRRFNHDTNTTMAGLFSNMDRLDQLDLSAPAQDLLTKLRMGLKRIHGAYRFVQKMQPTCKRIALRPELERIILDYVEMARFEIHGCNAQTQLETDRDYLQIVLDNLIRNALEAYQRREIPGSEWAIEIRFDAAEQKLYLRDWAGGVDPQLKDRIFDLYVSSKAVKQETGVGLASVREIMDLLEGSVALSDPQPNDGAEFVLQFPQD